MATIRPFRAFRYAQSGTISPDDLVAPPYDVLTSEEADDLRARPYNITNLTLPTEGAAGGRYEQAALQLREWIEQDILRRDESPSIYRYEQEFSNPMTGDRIIRTGMVVRLQLVEFGPGGVLPHERTLSSHREDRFRLRQATGADLEPIFGMYPGEEVLPSDAESDLSSPLLEVHLAPDVRHRLWRISDPESIDSVVRGLAEREVFIVDGHHRYTTALRQSREEGLAEDHPLASIMIFLCSMRDAGLVILPTHRIVRSIERSRIDAFLQQATEWFTVEPQDSAESAFARLRLAHDGPTYAVLTYRGALLLRARLETVERVRSSYPSGSPLAELDVTILHDLLFQELLGLSRSLQDGGEAIEYSRNDREAIEAISSDGVELVVGMRPPTIDEVEQVARAGEVMPQKSTFFYPKLASGLLLSVDEDHRRPAGDA